MVDALEDVKAQDIQVFDTTPITTLFDRVVAVGEMASAFPIREYWLDVGRIPDLARATDEYDTIFDNGTGDVPASETTPINWNESKS